MRDNLDQLNSPATAVAGPAGRSRFSMLVGLSLLWGIVIAGAMICVARYSVTPGAVGKVPAHWPESSLIMRDVERATLLMFAHPNCPCTRASLAELAQLTADCRGRVSAQVWFVQPVGTDPQWTNTDLWAMAAAIPGVAVAVDHEGREARRFAAETSGQTLLFDQAGQLQFQGGITLARGHMGDNPGLLAVEARLQTGHGDVICSPVFGCGLQNRVTLSPTTLPEAGKP